MNEDFKKLLMELHNHYHFLYMRDGDAKPEEYHFGLITLLKMTKPENTFCRLCEDLEQRND